MDETLLICGSTSAFPDDRKGECFSCHRLLVFRPHSPTNVKKICLLCAAKRLKDDPNPDFRMSKEVKAEVLQFFKGNLS